MISPSYFSTLASLAVAALLILLSLIFKINVVYSEAIGKIPPVFVLLPIGAIFGLTFIKNVPPMVLKVAYVVVAILVFVFAFSQLQYSVESAPEEYESMYDWNAAKGLSWMLFLPITLICTTFLGLVFDSTRNKLK